MEALGENDRGGSLSRRAVLGLAAMTGVGLLAGCQRRPSELLASRGDMASAWAAELPRAWSLKLLDDPQQVLAQRDKAELLQLSDGWAGSLDPAAQAPIANAALLARLDPAAQPVSRLFLNGGPARAWPWSVSPWVLVLRNRPDLMRHAAEGWNLLLDPSLAGKLVLPSSPRVILALIGEDAGRLAQLRRAAMAYDEPNGLNLLLRGGKPTPEPPLEWLAALLEPPLLPKLLRTGWVPPLPIAALERAATGLPDPLARLLAPPQEVWSRCFSLPPLTEEERRRLQRLWDASAPAAASAAR